MILPPGKWGAETRGQFYQPIENAQPHGVDAIPSY